MPLLVDRLKPHRDPSRSTMFQALFVMQKAQIMHEQGLTPFLMGQSGATLEMAGLAFESMTLEQWVAQFDLSLAASQAKGGTSLGMQYNTDLFDADTIERMMDHFESLLRAIVADPQSRISGLRMLSDKERHEQLVQWNATVQTRSDESLVHERFERQAAARRLVACDWEPLLQQLISIGFQRRLR